MSFQIDQPSEPTGEFLRARHIAGASIEQQFKTQGGDLPPNKDYRWIKAEMTWPSFDHLTFGYGNQVFSVLISRVDGNISTLTQREIQRCIDTSAANHLVPCLFEVDAKSFQAKSTGWNLTHLETGEPIVPSEVATDEKIPMSEWELRNFSIQIVRDHLSKQENAEILSFCDIPDIDPQIWFQDASGMRKWAVIRHYPAISGEEKNEFIGLEEKSPQLKPYDGYFAAVSLASAEPFLYDQDGSIIPLSERFTGNAPLYRGDNFYVKFDGLQRIYVC